MSDARTSEMPEPTGERGLLGNVALGQAMERYHNDAKFHAVVYMAVEVVMGERESKILDSFRRSNLSVGIATEAAAVALHLAEHFDNSAPETDRPLSA